MSTEKLENHTIEHKSNHGGHGFGVRLRAAREAKKLSVDDVAKKLFLTSRLIEQIENDNYQNTPAVTFMRGYLRLYAGLVDIDADSIISEFNRLQIVDAPVSMSMQRIYHRETTFITKNLSWLAILIAACVLLIIIMVLHSNYSNSDVNAAKAAAGTFRVGSVAQNTNQTPASDATLLPTTTSVPKEDSVINPMPDNFTSTDNAVETSSAKQKALAKHTKSVKFTSPF